jgi:hypothetical protein
MDGDRVQLVKTNCYVIVLISIIIEKWFLISAVNEKVTL